MGSQDEWNEDRLLEHFDRLVEQGLVIFNPKYRTIAVSDRGVSFEFRLLDGLATKPAAPRDHESRPSSRHPGCRPGSDINVSGYEVASIGTTHLLAANKFPAARPHFLILTQDGYRRQHEALDLDDLTAACQVLASFRRRHLLLFNCGIDGGCSRLHKHMQVLPAPEDFALWPDEEEPNLPFQSFRRRFSDGIPPPNALLDIYRDLLGQAEKALGRETQDGEAAVPHNVVMDRSWLVVIPRRAAGWNGADTNAAGMLGSVWVRDEKQLQLWLEPGPANILTRIGLPVYKRTTKT